MTLPIGIPVALIITYLLYRLLHPAFISPLSKIPSAHPTVPFAPAWLWWQRWRRRESRSIHAAHQRCGPIVRLAPREVSVASLAGVRQVYGGLGGGFPRTAWFAQFRNYGGTPNLVSMFDRRQHAVRRRGLAPVYAKSYLLSSSDFQKVAETIIFERLLPVLEDAARAGEDVDVFALGSAATAEIMSAYALGIGNSLDIVRHGKEEERERYLENGKRKLKGLKGAARAAKELEEQFLEMCEKVDYSFRWSSMEQKESKGTSDGKSDLREVVHGPLKRPSTYPVVYTQLAASIPAKEGVTNPQETLRLIASELLDSLEAARVAIGITLTYAMYRLSQQPALRTQLRDELATLPLSPSGPPCQRRFTTDILRKLDSLPLLNGVIKETMRVHPPQPGPLYRIVPEGGAVVEGYLIPAGTTISSSPRCLHRHEGTFPAADVWSPERWTKRNATEDGGEIEKGGEQDDPQRWFWVFGSGGRMCIANEFSLLVLKLLVASVYVNLTSKTVDDQETEQLDDMPADPIQGRLLLRFVNA